MSATIARAIGVGKDSTGEASRLGTIRSEAQANTFNTFTTVGVNADGSGYIRVERLIGEERVPILSAVFGAEDREENKRVFVTTRELSRSGFTTFEEVLDEGPVDYGSNALRNFLLMLDEEGR